MNPVAKPVPQTPPPQQAPQPLTAIEGVMKEIDTLIRARYPIIYLLTHEESRLETLLQQLASKQGKTLYTWTATSGLRQLDLSNEGAKTQTEFTDPVEVLSNIQTRNTNGLFLLKRFPSFPRRSAHHKKTSGFGSRPKGNL